MGTLAVLAVDPNMEVNRAILHNMRSSPSSVLQCLLVHSMRVAGRCAGHLGGKCKGLPSQHAFKRDHLLLRCLQIHGHPLQQKPRAIKSPRFERAFSPVMVGCGNKPMGRSNKQSAKQPFPTHELPHPMLKGVHSRAGGSCSPNSFGWSGQA